VQVLLDELILFEVFWSQLSVCVFCIQVWMGWGYRMGFHPLAQTGFWGLRVGPEFAQVYGRFVASRLFAH
jgi:hypothetical protein